MQYVRAFEAERAALAKPGDTPAEKVLMVLNKQQIERLKHLFRTCHALAKNSRPFTDYLWLRELDAQKGVDIGTTNRNDKAAQTFTHYIGEVVRLEMEAHFNEAHFFAPLSTDKSVIEQEIVYVRVAKQGRVKEQFVSLEHVEKAELGSSHTEGSGKFDSWLSGDHPTYTAVNALRVYYKKYCC